jgi:hypothetical protein
VLFNVALLMLCWGVVVESGCRGAVPIQVTCASRSANAEGLVAYINCNRSR